MDPRAAEKGRDIMIGRDQLAHPDFMARMVKFGEIPFPGCVGPLAYTDRKPLERDLAHLAAAVDKAEPAETFMTAPSPGILTRFVINLHYPDEAAYRRSARQCDARPNTRRSSAPASCCRSMRPTSARRATTSIGI